jgi:PTH1 family peptidyl-tRNA hydrolase
MVSKRKSSRQRALLKEQSEWDGLYQDSSVSAPAILNAKPRRQPAYPPTSEQLHLLPDEVVASIEGMSISRRVPLLIVSIGNPGSQHANTYHSAGHVLLNLLRREGAQQHDWAFHQSTSLMNVSGAGVRKQYDRFSASHPSGRMVVLHDELEREVGWVGVKNGWTSAKGHNGIKSIQQKMPRNVDWYRLAIGVGRPTSRDPDVVARYVLSKMKPAEISKIDAKVGDAMDKLEDISDGKVPS